jgi:molybdopterin biosynthesis enzyme
MNVVFAVLLDEFGRAYEASTLLARSHCLVVRPPHAPAAKAGDSCRIIRLAAT